MPNLHQLFTPPWWCVCLYLSVRDHIFRTTRTIFMRFSVPVAYGRGSDLLWGRSDTLCTSSFIHDVKRGAHVALGLAINCAQ